MSQRGVPAADAGDRHHLDSRAADQRRRNKPVHPLDGATEVFLLGLVQRDVYSGRLQTAHERASRGV